MKNLFEEVLCLVRLKQGCLLPSICTEIFYLKQPVSSVSRQLMEFSSNGFFKNIIIYIYVHIVKYEIYQFTTFWIAELQKLGSVIFLQGG